MTTESHDDQDASTWDGRGIINTPDGPATGTDEDW